MVQDGGRTCDSFVWVGAFTYLVWDGGRYLEETGGRSTGDDDVPTVLLSQVRERKEAKKRCIGTESGKKRKKAAATVEIPASICRTPKNLLDRVSQLH
ncbi:hypothetical protein Tco_0566463 [Tanacetum coccineum]